MKLLISGRHLDVSKSIIQYARKRFSKWSTFLSPHAEVHVTLFLEGYRQTVEVTAQDKTYTLNGRQTTKDMHQSIDLLAEKIGHQLARQHGKLVHTKSLGKVSRKSMALPDSRGFTPAGPIIDVEALSGKPMSADEAALQLQASRKPFLVFIDAETSQLAVISKQKDGVFKLIVKE